MIPSALAVFKLITSSTFTALPDWQVPWLFAFQYPTGVDACMSKRLADACAVAHKTASIYELTQWIDCRQVIVGCQCDDLFSVIKEQLIGSKSKRANTLLNQ